MAKDYTIVKKWDDDFEGSAIYSLIDEDGKRYIGQAVDVQRRLHAHRMALNRAFRNPDAESDEGQALCDYARSGRTFTVEILKKFKWSEATYNILCYWEAYFVEKFGGYKNTYNSQIVPVVNEDYAPFNDVRLKVEFTQEELDFMNQKTDNITEYIKELIRRDISGKMK